jgi:hypothetical protein
MKLIKILRDFNTPLKKYVTDPYPRNNQEVLDADAILVSDEKYMLLYKNHVFMKVLKDFTETAVHNMVDFNKQMYYIVTKVKASEFGTDGENFDVSPYKIGDLIFFYSEPEVKAPIKPREPRIHEGTFAYELSEEEKKAIMEEYNEKLEVYNEELETFTEGLKEFFKNEVSLPIFGCLAEVVRGNKVKIIWDASFETTKDNRQFGILGKLPKGVATKVTNAIGNIAEGASINGLSLSNILTDALGLETEEELVGQILPKTASAAKFGKPVASESSVSDTSTPITISAGMTIKEGYTVSGVVLVDADGNEYPASGTDEVSATVTPSKTSTYYFKATLTKDGDESGKTFTAKSSKVSVKLTIEQLAINVTANPTSIVSGSGDSSTITITATKGEIASIEINDGTSTDTKTSAPWTFTVTPTVTTQYIITATATNGTTATKKVSVAVTQPAPTPIVAPTITLTVSPTTITTATGDVTLTIKATKGTGNLTQIVLEQGSTTLETYTTGLEETITKTVTGINATTTFTATVTDSNSKTASKDAKVTYNYTAPKPSITSVTPSPTTTTASGEVTVTVVSSDGGASPTKVTLYRNSINNANKIDDKTFAATTTFTVSGGHSNGDKFIAVVTYDTDKTVQKTSSAITVEVPTAKLWWGNYAGIASQVDRPEDDGDIRLDEVTVEGIQEYMTLSQTQSVNAAKGTFQINVPDFHGLLEQQLVLVPTSVGTTITFVSNGFNATTSFEKKTITVDGIEYTALLSTSLLYDDGEIDMHITIA